MAEVRLALHSSTGPCFKSPLINYAVLQIYPAMPRLYNIQYAVAECEIQLNSGQSTAGRLPFRVSSRGVTPANSLRQEMQMLPF